MATAFDPARWPSYILAAQACQDAHATVVLWSSWSDFITNSIVLFILAPMASPCHAWAAQVVPAFHGWLRACINKCTCTNAAMGNSICLPA